MALRYHKKAQLSTHFHWIFVLIAGAIILTFFVSIVVKQKDISEQNIAGKAITGLDQIFTAAGVAEDTFNKIEIPKIEMEFICQDDFSEFSIRKTGLNRNLQTDLIFSPDLVKGNEIFIWTLPWNFPFTVDNFLMITSPEVRYIILHDSFSEYNAVTILDDLPDQLTKEIHAIEELDNLAEEDNYKVKLIFVTEQPIFDFEIPELGDETSIVQIANGFIRYYQLEDGQVVSDYQKDYFFILKEIERFDLIGNEKDPMIYSAIFAENSEMYRCALKKAFKRLELISSIYKKRIESLELFYNDLFAQTNTPFCEAHYYPAPFSQLESGARQCSINPAEQCFQTILQQTNSIIIANEGTKGTDCPRIY